MGDQGQIQAAIACLEAGDKGALDSLIPVLYQELHRLAEALLSRERPDHTLQPTALVHEAYMRLVEDGEDEENGAPCNRGPLWANRRHFFAAAAEAMRRILVENARRKAAAKAGAGRERVDLAEAEPAIEGPCLDLMAFDEALAALEVKDKRQLERVVSAIRRISGVRDVERVNERT